jgi:hypothetical protein
MRINELIEAIDQTGQLTQNAYNLLIKEIDQFIDWNAESIFDSVGEGDYLKKMDALDDRIEKIREKNLDWQEEDRQVTKLSNMRQDLSGEVQSKLYKSEPDQDLLDEFIDVMEMHLQDLARDYIEAQFGKIEADPSLPYDERKQQNLNWLQHIIVQIDTTGVDSKTGEPKTGGGYFARNPQKSALHSRSSQKIDWQNDLLTHINIYSSREKLWTALTRRLLDKDSTRHYGDSGIENPVPKLVAEIVKTFVHETVHMDQNARANIKMQSTNRGFGRGDYTKIPDTSVPRPQLYSYDKNDTRGKAGQKDNWRRKYRGGRRGQETYDVDNFEHNLDRWAAYLGSVNEIEAHASHAASEMYMNFMEHEPFRYSYSDNDKQRRINDFVDSAIEDVRWGEFPNRTYPSMIAPTAKQALNNPDPTPRERQFVKVWNLYIKKMIKHLQSYKKDVPEDKY